MAKDESMFLTPSEIEAVYIAAKKSSLKSIYMKYRMLLPFTYRTFYRMLSGDYVSKDNYDAYIKYIKTPLSNDISLADHFSNLLKLLRTFTNERSQVNWNEVSTYIKDNGLAIYIKET